MDPDPNLLMVSYIAQMFPSEGDLGATVCALLSELHVPECCRERHLLTNWVTSYPGTQSSFYQHAQWLHKDEH